MRWLTHVREVAEVSEVKRRWWRRSGWLHCLCLCRCRQTDGKWTEVRSLTHAREVTEVSEVTTTVVETVWLAPLLVSVSVQTD